MAHEPAPSGGGDKGGEKKGALASLSPGKLFVGVVTGFVLIGLIGGALGCVATFDPVQGVQNAAGNFVSGVKEATDFSSLDVLDGEGGNTSSFGSKVGIKSEPVDPMRAFGSCSLAFTAFSLSVSGWFLGIFATAFDFSLISLVTNMGSFLGKQSPFAEGIEIGWKILRDLANLAFIIAMIWTAISIILNLGEGKASPTKTVVSILVAAVLVNFSYLFGAVIIDASNFVTHKIYQEGISSEEYVNPFSKGGVGGNVWEAAQQGVFSAPVTSRFMQMTGIASIYEWRNKLQEDKGFARDLGTNYMLTMLLGMFGLIFFSMAAGIFAVATVFIIIRFVIVALLLMLSPFGIMAFIGQKPFKDWGMAWWKELQAQALFPIVFVFMIALSLKFVEVGVEEIARGDASFYTLLTTTGDGAGIYNNLHLIFIFGISIALLYFSLKMATDTATHQPFKAPSTAWAFQGASQLQKIIGQLNPMSWGRKGAQALVSEYGLESLADIQIGNGYRLRNIPGVLYRNTPILKRFNEEAGLMDEAGIHNQRSANANLSEMKENNKKIKELSKNKAANANEIARLEKENKELAAETKPMVDSLPDYHRKVFMRTAFNEGYSAELGQVLGASQSVFVSGGVAPGNADVAQATKAVREGDSQKISASIDKLSTILARGILLQEQELLKDDEIGRGIMRGLKTSHVDDLVRNAPPSFFTLDRADFLSGHVGEMGGLAMLQRQDIPKDIRENMKVMLEENNPRVADSLKNSPSWLRL